LDELAAGAVEWEAAALVLLLKPTGGKMTKSSEEGGTAAAEEDRVLAEECRGDMLRGAGYGEGKQAGNSYNSLSGKSLVANSKLTTGVRARTTSKEPTGWWKVKKKNERDPRMAHPCSLCWRGIETRQGSSKVGPSKGRHGNKKVGNRKGRAYIDGSAANRSTLPSPEAAPPRPCPPPATADNANGEGGTAGKLSMELGGLLRMPEPVDEAVDEEGAEGFCCTKLKKE
jgi:hypothetical protein